MKLKELEAAYDASLVYDMSIIRVDWSDAAGFP
jgi:hypothetical protein